MADNLDYHQAVVDVAAAWLEDFLRLAIKRAQNRGLQRTGALVRSIFGSIKEIDQAGRVDITLSYNLSGKFRDIKGLRYSHQAPVDDLVEFVRLVGIDKFKFIPGYQGSNRVPTQDEAIRRIAWGIARSRLERPAFGKPWMLNTLFKRQMNNLTELLVARTGTATIAIIERQFQIENNGKG